MPEIIDILGGLATATWDVFYLASPFVLLGLGAAGVLHVLIPARQIARWLGRPGLGSTARAALLGVPLPLCSCAVVPVTIELSRKGASREASLAFMVSTPETGVDSILLSWALMGPVMAVVRPVAALATSLVAAATSLLVRDDPAAGERTESEAPVSATEGDAPARHPGGRWRAALRYGFAYMVDEIGPWLVFGIALTGVITALVPDDLIPASFGSGPAAYFGLLILGIPLYLCASASTPIAAALMLKGFSAGAVLVFLLAGPATNASTLILVARFFGRRFVSIYLASVMLVAVASGFVLDLLIDRLGWEVVPTLALGGEETGRLIHLASAVVLLGLLAWSATRGSWRMAFGEVTADLRNWRQLLGGAAPEAPASGESCGCDSCDEPS